MANVNRAVSVGQRCGDQRARKMLLFFHNFQFSTAKLVQAERKRKFICSLRRSLTFSACHRALEVLAVLDALDVLEKLYFFARLCGKSGEWEVFKNSFLPHFLLNNTSLF
jgi:hypothetical protein